MANRNDIHCQFGVTAQIAQTLEVELSNILLGLEGIENKLYDKDKKTKLNEVRIKINKRTLGMLFCEVKKLTSLDENTEEIITEAVEIRNNLSHKFYSKYTPEIESKNGCDEVMKVLQNMYKKLLQAVQLSQTLSKSTLDELKNDIKNTQ